MAKKKEKKKKKMVRTDKIVGWRNKIDRSRKITKGAFKRPRRRKLVPIYEMVKTDEKKKATQLE